MYEAEFQSLSGELTVSDFKKNAEKFLIENNKLK